MVDVQILTKFGESLLGVFGSTCISMIVGGLLALVISIAFGMRNAIVRILEFGTWFSFLLFWALPFYIDILVPASLTLTPFVAYHFLSVQQRSSWLKLPILSVVAYRTILQALLFYIVFDIWFPNGWLSLSLFSSLSAACFVIVFSIVFLALLIVVFRVRFSFMADQRTLGLLNELRTSRDYGYVALLTGLLFTLWIVVPEKVLYAFHVPTLSAVLKSFPLLFRDENLLSETILSISEIIAGIISAGILGTFLLMRQRENISSGVLLESLLFTAVIPLLISLPIAHWLGPDVAGLGVVLDAGLLAFYPYVEAYWGLRNHSLNYRILLAAHNAFPWALIGMLFGETISSSRGLVFRIVFNRNTFVYDRSLGIALWLSVMFILVSYVLRVLAQRTKDLSLKSAS